MLQPSDERRRSGSHYTPRSLTEPIVRHDTGTNPDNSLSNPMRKPRLPPSRRSMSRREKTNERYTKGEIANRVRQSERAIEYAKQAREVGTPHPSQILDLKICDPAMGSGAFLVETCRQLGDELIKAWYAHDAVPTDIPPDEDEVLYARRLVAQRCLYGVDKNDMAVDLAKLSLWLVTLAKDHPFTFLDHCATSRRFAGRPHPPPDHRLPLGTEETEAVWRRPDSEAPRPRHRGPCEEFSTPARMCRTAIRSSGWP